jgi:MOSC domain-containing protein YiiM
MRVLSVNVGLPREVTWRGKPVTTGIYKEPVGGRVAVATLSLAGDAQADLRVHGGRDKAVYAYPSEYYELWSRARPELELDPGTFGENLTTEGLRLHAQPRSDRRSTTGVEGNRPSADD